MNTSFEKNYKKIFTAVFITTGLFLSALIIILVYFETSRANDTLLEKQANYYLNEKKTTINKFIKDHYEIVSAFSNNDFYFNYLEQNSYNNFQLFLRTIHSYNKNIKNITYTNSEGDELIKLKRYKPNSTFILNHEQNLMNISSSQTFKNILLLENGDLYISKIKQNAQYTVNNKENKKDNKYEISIGYKIYENFELIGVFILDLYVDDILKDIVNTSNFDVYITDNNSCLYATNKKDTLTSTKNNCIKTDFQANSNTEIYKAKDQILTLSIVQNKEVTDFFSNLNKTYIAIFIIIIVLSFLLSSYLSDIPRKLNQKIKEQKKMFIQQSKFAAMGEMISVISHQWRQPLNEITVLIDEIKLKHQYNILSHDELEQLANEIYDSTDYMSNTIEDFNNFFKPSKDKQNFTISSILTETQNLLSSRLSKFKVNLQINIQDNHLSYIGYKNELKQVIINIINNAIDALDERLVPNKAITIDINKLETHIKITIEDNAGGIPIEIIDDIFNPYFSTKTEKNGTGLGLYISKLIIENNMQGEIDVENINKGAKFSILLPLEN